MSNISARTKALALFAVLVAGAAAVTGGDLSTVHVDSASGYMIAVE